MKPLTLITLLLLFFLSRGFKEGVFFVLATVAFGRVFFGANKP